MKTLLAMSLACNLGKHSKLQVLNHSITSRALNRADYICKEMWKEGRLFT
jgi:hypothetical protein